MSLLHLSIQKMFRLSKPWVEKKRPVLESIPEVKGLLPKIDEAHNGLRLLSKSDAPLPPRLIEISKEQEQIDIRHDVLIDVGYGKLSLLALFLGESEQAKTLISLRGSLFPEGLIAKNRGYGEEAGAAELLEKNLTNTQQLREIPITNSYTMLDLVEEYIAKGKQLGVLEDEKKEILKGEAAPSNRAELQRARHTWIRVARALESIIDLTNLDAKVVDDLLGDLRKADKVVSIEETETKEDETIPAEQN